MTVELLVADWVANWAPAPGGLLLADGKMPKEGLINFTNFLLKKFQVHFSIKRYPIDELPADSTEQMGEWLNERWEEKEAKLKEFYKNDKQFHNSRHPYWDRRALSIWVALIFWPVFRLD